MAGENSSSAHSQSFHVNAVPSAMGLQRLEQCSSLQFTGDVQLARVPDAVTGASPTTVAVIGGAEKRKRGRPPRYQAVRPQPPLKRPREEEEDVCFICFDGGSLVLCDRKGCPKAYHPKCIKRDEAFFRSKAKWNCGWHICSVCQRASHYLCYTCTYSLCKACTKNTEYLCVRGNKGFCSMCMKTIMLIENKDQANKVQVDFDDKTSFEYLFKVYWVILKEKLSLTLDELVQAKNPWKESDAMYGKQQLMSYGYCIANGGNGVPGKSFDNLELKKPVELAGLSKKDPPITERRTIGDFNNVSNLSSPPQSELSTREIAESSNVIILSSIPPSEASKKDRPTTENCAIAESNSASFLSSAPNPELTKPVEKLELQNEDCSGKKQGSSTAVETSVNGRMEWASKELLDFVGHVKGGDTSAISQFDVQALLLDYIKRNNLRDPRRKSQILCDLRLKSLFGKPRVGHIEMLKLLEFHFLIKEESEKSAFIPAGIVGTVMGSVKPDVYSDLPSLTNNTRKRKTRKNGEVKMTQINLDGYAAIDAHNIKSIYLRRDLMENLVEDVEKFRDRVIGSVVRIRLPGNDQKQEIYRLVHVVGTCKSSEPYKIRDKTVDVLLEVLNLDKKEAISIDSISNQDFCEDECRRLRQSIKCGFVKRPTVGEIQKKAIELMAIKLNDSLEAEILRLNHLRDRASEKGHKKELRECIEKLELLKTPGERQRRLLEIPEVHADPKMDPTYGSDGDDGDSNYKRKVGHPAPRYTRIGRRGEKFMPSGTLVKEEVSTVAQSRMSEKREACGTNILDKLVNRLTVDQAVDRSGSETSVATLSTANSSSAISSETEKMWHYRDPAGNIQGPFCVIQLRKWNTSGLFPPDMRIWTNHEHDDSVLLTNVLKGLYHKSPPQLHRKPSSQPQETASADSRHSGRLSDSVTGTGRECGEREAPGHLYNGNKRSNPNTQYMKGLDLSKGLNSSSDKPQPSIPVPSPSQLVPILALPHQERGHENDNRRSVADHVTQRSRRSRVWQKGDGYNHTNTQSNGWNVGQSSGRNQSSDSLVQKGKMEVPNLPSPTPETSYGELEADAAEKLLLLSSVIPVCGSDFQDLRSPTISHHEAQGGHASENIESPVPESGHKSRSSANHEAQGGHAAENIESSVQLSGHKSRSNVNHEAQGGHAAENIESPVQESGDKSRSNANHEAQGGYAAKIKESFVRESDHRWSNANHEAGGHVANNESPVRESGHRWNSADHEAQGGHAAEIKEFFVEESGHGCSNANHEAGEHVANKGSPVPELGHRWSSADNEAQGGHAAEIKESFVRESCRGCSNANHEAGGHVANEESPIRESGYRWSSENHEAQGGHAAETKESFVQESGHGWSNANQETGGYATNKESPVLELGHRWINANHEGQGGHAAEAEESFVQESSHGWSNANQEAGGYAANKESPVLELGHRWINANHEGQGGRAAEINESSPVQESGHRWSNANNEAQGQGGRAAEINESSPSDPPAQDSGPSNAYLEPHFGSATENKDPFPSNLPPVQESGPSNANHEGRGGHAAEIKESVLSNLPVEESVSRWSNAKHEAQGAHAAESKGSFPSGLPVQESGHRWSSASSLVIDGAQLREIGDEEWDSGILSISPLKSGDAVVDEVATPITTADQLNHSSPAHPLFNFFSEPIEFSTLAEESVSDLLAEVDAMESQNQNGMGSPTSAMRCGLEMMPGCRNDDYFSPIDELSLAHNPVKSDALSSTGDLQLPCQSTLTNVAAGASRADAFDVLKRSGGNSSTSSEGETKSTDVLFSHGEAGSNIPATCTTSQNAVFSSTIGRSTGFGVTNGRGTASIPNWAGPVQGYANVGLGGMGTSWGNSHMSFSTPFHGNPVWDNQRRYTVGRSGGPRDWALQGGDSGFGRGRSSLNNRQQPYGSGGYSRQSPKGQRICKFYESGRCKKGAMCDYLHP